MPDVVPCSCLSHSAHFLFEHTLTGGNLANLKTSRNTATRTDLDRPAYPVAYRFSYSNIHRDTCHTHSNLAIAYLYTCSRRHGIDRARACRAL